MRRTRHQLAASTTTGHSPIDSVGEDVPAQRRKPTEMPEAVFAFRLLNAETLSPLNRDDIERIVAQLQSDGTTTPIPAALEVSAAIPADIFLLSLGITGIEKKADAATHAGLGHIISGQFMDLHRDTWRPFRLLYNIDELHGIFRTA